MAVHAVGHVDVGVAVRIARRALVPERGIEEPAGGEADGGVVLGVVVTDLGRPVDVAVPLRRCRAGGGSQARAVVGVTVSERELEPP